VPPNSSGTTAYLSNGAGQYLLAQVFSPTGTQLPTSASQLVPVQVSQTAFAGQPTANASLTAVVPAAGATAVTAPFSYIDSAGVTQTLTLNWSSPTVNAGPPSTTDWTLSVTDANGAAVGTSTTMTFDDLGAAVTPTTLPITATSTAAGPTGVVSASPTTFNLDLTNVAMLGNATTTGSTGGALAQIVSYTQDGLPAGNFEQLSINSDGTIINKYSGGATATVYQIPLTVFPAPNALFAKSGDVFEQTQGAGTPTFVFPGNAFASLKAGAVETANVDLSDSFSQMILVQRAYQSAAQVLKVADDMTTVATNLKR